MRIFLNNIEIPVSENLEIQASLLSPLFNVNDGSYLFNFTVPGTDTLYRALGWKHRMNTPRPVDVAFRLEHGSIRMKATAIVTQCDADNYEVSVGIGKGDFNYLIKDLKLKDPDIDWGTVTPWENTSGHTGPINISNPYSAPDDFILDWTIIHEGIGAFEYNMERYIAGEHHTDYNVIINFHEWNNIAGTAYFKVFKYDVGGSLVTTNSYTITTGLKWINFTEDLDVGEKLKFVIQLGVGAAVRNDNKIKLTIFEKASDVMATSPAHYYPERDFVFFPVLNYSLFEKINNTTLKNNYANFPFVNYFNDTGEFPLMWTGLNGTGATVTIANIFMPFLYVGYVLEKIVSHFGYIIKDNLFENTEWQQMVLMNFYVDYNYSDHSDVDHVIYPNIEMSLKNQLPDMLISDFMKSLAMVMGCAIDVNINRKEIQFIPLSSIIKSKISIDWNDKYSGNLSKFDQLYNGYELKYDAKNDDYITDHYKAIDFTAQKQYNFIGDFATKANVPSGDYNINDVYYNTTYHRYYVWTFDTSTSALNWVDYSLDFVFNIIKNSADLNNNNLYQLVSNLIPLMRSELYLNMVLPVTKQAGYFKNGMETWDVAQMPGILMYRKNQMRLDHLSMYPLADNDIYDIDGNQIGDISLRLESKGGVLERWQDFLDFIIACRQLEIFRELNEIDIIKLAFDKKIMIEGKLVLLSEVKFKLSAKGVDVDEIWGFTA